MHTPGRKGSSRKTVAPPRLHLGLGCGVLQLRAYRGEGSGLASFQGLVGITWKSYRCM